MIEHFINQFLPPIISIIELIGIFIVIVSATKSFWHYLQNIFTNKSYKVQFDLAQGLATGLEFKMAAEILKTVLVREMSELLILGAVIILRGLLSFLIYFELKHSKEE